MRRGGNSRTRSCGITGVGFEQKDTWNRWVTIYRTDGLLRGTQPRM